MSNSILDAFNAAARFSGQVLDHATKKNQEEINRQFFNDDAIIQTNIQNWTRDNPFVGSADELGDEYAFEEYLSKLNYIIDEQHGLAGNKNGSQYYQQQLDQGRVQRREMARNYTLAEENKWRISREKTNFESDVQRYMDAGWEPQKTLQAIYNRIDLHGVRNGLDPERRNAYRQALEIDVYQQAAARFIRQIDDVNNLETAMQQVRDAFGFMPSNSFNIYDEQGNITGTEERPWGYSGRDEWEQELIKNETARIQGEHYEEYREKQSYFQRLIVSGEIDQAIRFARTNGAEWNKYYNPNNREYANSNRDFRDRGENWFDYRTLEGYLNQGRNGPDAAKIEITPGRMIRAVLPGGGNYVITGENGEGFHVESLKDAWEKFISLQENAYRQTNGYGAIADSNWYDRRETWFQTFKNEMRQIIQEDEHSELWSVYRKLLDYDTYRDDNRDNPYFLRSNISESQRSLFIQDTVSFVMDSFWSGVTNPVELDNRIKGFIVGDISDKLIWGQTPTNESELTKLASWSREVMNGMANHQVFSPTRMETAGLFSNEPSETDYIWRHSTFKNESLAVRNKELGYVSNILGITREQLIPRWMVTNDRERDPIPKGMFVIQSGQHAGTYYLDYDDNANPIVMRRNNSGGWTEYRRGTRQLTPTEQRDQQRRIENEYRQTVYNDRHPFTGNAFNAQLRPPPGSGITQAAWQAGGTDIFATWAGYFHELENNPSMIDSIVARGINPFDGATLIIDRQPVPGHEREWNTLSYERKVQLWTNEFKTRLTRR